MKALAIILFLTSCGPVNFIMQNPRASRAAVVTSFRKMNKKSKEHHLKKHAATGGTSSSLGNW